MSEIEDAADEYAGRFSDGGQGAISKLGFMQAAYYILGRCQVMTFHYSKPPMRAVTCRAVNIEDIEEMFRNETVEGENMSKQEILEITFKAALLKLTFTAPDTLVDPICNYIDDLKKQRDASVSEVARLANEIAKLAETYDFNSEHIFKQGDK